MCEPVSGIPHPPPLVLPSDSSCILEDHLSSQKNYLTTYTAKCKQKEMQFKLVGAIESGDIHEVQELIVAGVNIDCIILLVKIPLVHAIELGFPDIANLLINSGSDPNKAEKNALAHCPLHAAIIKNMETAVFNLIKHGADFEIKDGAGMSPLQYAVFYGYKNIVKYLIHHGADVNSKDSVQRSAIHRAVEQNHLNIAEYLLKNGADVNSKDKYGWTPIFNAIVYDQIHAIYFLLSKNADLNVQDYTGDTPLHIACSRFRREKIYVVLSTSEDLERRQRRIPTAYFTNLLHGYQGSNIAVVKLLLDAGSNVDVKNNNGLTALALSINRVVVQYLMSAGATVDQDWIEAILTNTAGEDVDFFQWLHEQSCHQMKLTVICKKTIRKFLAHTRQISVAIEYLEFPASLKDFLKV